MQAIICVVSVSKQPSSSSVFSPIGVACIKLRLVAKLRPAAMEQAEEDDEVPFSQLVAMQPDLVLPDHNFDLNTPTGSPANLAASVKQKKRHGKLFNDPVHNTFRLDPVSIDIIDSAQFQRLRDLKQLGMTYYIFPGASHNRFEHSLGTAHLAYEAADKIWNSQRAELDMDRGDVKVVELAGKSGLQLPFYKCSSIIW